MNASNKSGFLLSDPSAQDYNLMPASSASAYKESDLVNLVLAERSKSSLGIGRQPTKNSEAHLQHLRSSAPGQPNYVLSSEAWFQRVAAKRMES